MRSSNCWTPRERVQGCAREPEQDYHKLPPALSAAIDASFADWKNNNKVARLWKKDASLWSGTDESNWLGWLNITQEQIANLISFRKLAQEVKKAKFRHVLLLGMGGSSLCPECCA